MKKKMMKKVTAVLTGVVLAIGLTACGSQGGGSNTQQARQERESVTPESTREPSTTPEQATGNQSDAAQTGQETSGQETSAQTDQQPENGTAASAEDASQPSGEGGKTLVVYYSATGHTESVAGYIAAATDADIFVLEPVEPYSSADLDWTDKNSRVTKEHDNEDERNVELVSTTVEDWDSYDTVFIGYPIWWHIAAWPVDGFVTANDFTGKTVIPFCTSSSSDLGESGELLAEAAGTGDWLEGERFSSGASEETVRAWVESLEER